MGDLSKPSRSFLVFGWRSGRLVVSPSFPGCCLLLTYSNFFLKSDPSWE